MKIAIASINLQWQSGGTRQIFELAGKLQNAGHAVVVYATKINATAYPDLQRGLTIKIVPEEERPKSESKSLLSKIFSKIREDRSATEVMQKIVNTMDGDFDVVNYHDFAYKIGYFYKKKNPKVRAIWTMNEPPFLYIPKGSFLRDSASRVYNAAKEAFSKKFFRATDTVITLGSWDANWVKRHGMNAVIVWSGLDFEKFYTPVKKRSSTNLSKKANLLTIGNPNQYRRFEDAIEVVRILREWGYDVRLTVNAKNIWKEGAYCKKLVDLSAAYNLEDYVRLNFEGVSEEELRKIYTESDIFVHPIYVPPPRNGSTWGLVIFEAMAAGMPVILCRTAGAAEPLTDGVHALFVDPQNPGQFAEKIKILLDDPDLYNRIALAGQEFTKENISWEKYTNSVFKIFTFGDDTSRK